MQRPSRLRALVLKASAAAFALGASGVGMIAIPAPPAHASVVLDGAGSTWSAIAVNQWRADVNRTGLNINYNASGSTAGRVFYYTNEVDFAISEIPFTAAYKDATGTVVTNEIALAEHRPYVYLPIVAGGTSFMYHLDIGGQRFTNLQLDPPTISKIFTGVITNWDDPAIKALNPGVPFPNLAIRPVVRSDGSGTTAQFTAYMVNQEPAIWNAFCQKVGLPTPCPSTSLYPEFPGSVAQQLSDGVANYVAASYNNGAITYVEYGYAKERDFPVASMLNKAGGYAQPTAFNVAVALQGASFNSDGTQNLQGVYNYNAGAYAKDVYPISSYSYMIAPTTTAAPFSTDKGNVLGQFILYFACAGQQKAEQLGYSPMPRPLVANAFAAEARIPGAPAPPPLDYAHCQNPTLNGWPPQITHVTSTTRGPQHNGGNSGPGGGGGGSHNGGSSGSGGSAGSGGSGTSGTAGPGGSSASGGNTITTDAQGNIVDPGGIQNVAATSPVNTPGHNDGTPIFITFVVLALLAVIFGPPVLALMMKRRARSATG
jgi:phosphate transport system substrate-binding protein